MRKSASRAVLSGTQRKLDVKMQRSKRTAELFSAQLADKLRQDQSSPNDIGGLWVNIRQSLRVSAEGFKRPGFQRPPKRNQWHDKEYRAASAAKNDAYKRTLQSAATHGIVEDYRQRSSGPTSAIFVRSTSNFDIFDFLFTFSKQTNIKLIILFITKIWREEL